MHRHQRRGELDVAPVSAAAPHRLQQRQPAGQLAAVHSGMAVTVLTRCSVPPGLLVRGERDGLPPLPAPAAGG